MKTIVINKTLTGERALFASKNLQVTNCIFEDGESPLKESQDITIDNTSFRWKYPLWYCKNIIVNNSLLTYTARSGIWYTHFITINNSIIEAPKTFRRASNIVLNNIKMPHAEESFWNCQNVKLTNVEAVGDYLLMNSENVIINNLNLNGNYLLDGGRNIEIKNSKLMSKDAFWNCENVVVTDSYINGEYLGWNSKNVTFINCEIESLQGMCYMNGVKLINCKLINTTLCFEYSYVDAEITSSIDSVKNPYGGTIKAPEIKELILDENCIDPSQTKIFLEKDHV